MPARLKLLTRFVYVIGPAVGLQKIGLATDPRSRLAALQTASPALLVLHAAIGVLFGEAHAVERRAHAAMAGCRATGEWFQTTAGEAVIAVQAAAAHSERPISQEAVCLPLFAYQQPLARLERQPAAMRVLDHVRRAFVGRR